MQGRLHQLILDFFVVLMWVGVVDSFNIYIYIYFFFFLIKNLGFSSSEHGVGWSEMVFLRVVGDRKRSRLEIVFPEGLNIKYYYLSLGP
jgi:hypothetical protein